MKYSIAAAAIVVALGLSACDPDKLTQVNQDPNNPIYDRLLALRAGTTLIIETDDDNTPYETFWNQRLRQQTVRTATESGTGVRVQRNATGVARETTSVEVRPAERRIASAPRSQSAPPAT